MRFKRLIAVAKRDLKVEMKGRRGVVLPVVAAALLIPISTLDFSRDRSTAVKEVTVSGEVPAQVLALPNTTLVGCQDPTPQADQICIGQLHFHRNEQTLMVDAAHIPPTVRATLDGGSPALTVSTLTSPPIVLPGRTLLFALISASILTAAVASSVAGERSRGTMETLLTAALSRLEVVVGKWMAWSGFGALMAMAAALLAVMIGRIEGGIWLITLPFVPAAAVAIGLYLVRRDARLVAGATVSLRIIPAILSVTGVFAWVLGVMVSPLVGAAVPVGGVLVAAGGVWAGIAPTAVAIVSSTTVTAALLWLTARDLNRPPPPQAQKEKLKTIMGTLLLVLPIWWVPLLGPLGWEPAGSTAMSNALSPTHAAFAAGLGLTTLLCLRIGGATHPARESGLWIPKMHWRTILLSLIGLVLSQVFFADVTLGDNQVTERLALGLEPDNLMALLLSVMAIEVFCRRVLVTKAGWPIALLLFVLIFGLGNPLHALVIGAAGLWLTRVHGGSVVPIICVRLLASAVSFFAV